MAYMVAGALFSESFAVLALTCYVLLSFHVIMGLLPRDNSRPEPPDRASQREQPPRRAAKPQLGPGSRRRLVQVGRDRVAAPARPGQITSAKGRKDSILLLPMEPPSERTFGRSAPALLDAATLPAVQATALAAPARPGQITSAKGRKEPNLLLPKDPPAERAFGRSAPALLDAATLPAVQATALDRMLANTREAPKTPPAPSKLIRFRSHGADSAGAWEIVIHGDALASRLAFKLQQVEEQLARAWRAERRTADEKSLQHGVAVDTSAPAQRAFGCVSKPSMRRSPSVNNELSPNSAFGHRAPASPQGTGSKGSRCRLSLGIKGSRGPFVSSSSMFYAHVVSRQVRMQCGKALTDSSLTPGLPSGVCTPRARTSGKLSLLQKNYVAY